MADLDARDLQHLADASFSIELNGDTYNFYLGATGMSVDINGSVAEMNLETLAAPALVLNDADNIPEGVREAIVARIGLRLMFAQAIIEGDRDAALDLLEQDVKRVLSLTEH